MGQSDEEKGEDEYADCDVVVAIMLWDRVNRQWPLSKMREKLQEQATEIGERYDELWDGKAEGGLWEGGMSECDVWDLCEEQVIRDSRMWQIKGILRTLEWLRYNEGVEWGGWSESMNVEFMKIVRR